MNDTRIWSAAQMRALFPHKKTKRVHHLQAEDAPKKSMTGDSPVTFQPICSESPVPVFSFSARTILSQL